MYTARYPSSRTALVFEGLLDAGQLAALGAQDILFAGSAFSDSEKVISVTL